MTLPLIALKRRCIMFPQAPTRCTHAKLGQHLGKISQASLALPDAMKSDLTWGC